MSNRDLTPFERRLEDWRLAHPRRWVATTDRKEVAEFVSEQTEKIIGAQLEAADRVVVSQERIASGIDNMAYGIERLAEGLESLASAFDWAFSEMLWHLEQQRAVLDEILRTLQAPLDTQARELRRRAEDAYRNGWIDDALEDFLESERRNRYDFAIHQSLGSIYLFHKRDPEKALEYFEKAVKYAAPKSPYHASIALLHMGLVNYLEGDFRKAHEATSRAMELSPHLYEAHYQHAQYCANLGEFDEAIDHLEAAIDGDRYYCLKAGSEKDFDVMKQRLRSLFEDLRSEAQNQARDDVAEAQEYIQDAESYVLSNPGDFSDARSKLQAAKRKLNEAKEYLERDSLFDSWDATYEACMAQDVALKAHALARDALVEYYPDQIARVERERDRKEKELNKKTESWFRIATVVFGTMLILLCIGSVVSAFTSEGIGGGIKRGLICGLSLFLAFVVGGFPIAFIIDRFVQRRLKDYEWEIARFQANLSKVQTERGVFTVLRCPSCLFDNDRES